MPLSNADIDGPRSWVLARAGKLFTDSSQSVAGMKASLAEKPWSSKRDGHPMAVTHV